MFRLSIPLFLTVLITSVSLGQTESQVALDEAIAVLSAKAPFLGDAEERKILQDAIERLQELRTPAKQDAPAPDGPLNATTADFRKLLQGNVRYDHKKNELTIAYDLSNPKQLEDFGLKRTPANYRNGLILLSPGQAMKHTVKFATVDIALQCALQNFGGGLITSDGNYWVSMPPMNGDWTYLEVHANRTASKSPGINGRALLDQMRKRGVELAVRFDSKRVTARLGKVEIGTEVKDPEMGAVGQIQINALNGPAAFSNIIFRGTLDREWAKKFLDAPGGG